MILMSKMFVKYRLKKVNYDKAKHNVNVINVIIIKQLILISFIFSKFLNFNHYDFLKMNDIIRGRTFL